MKLSLLYCFLFLSLIISCGSDNDDNDDDVTVTPPTTPEEEEEDNVPSKYSSIILGTDDLYVKNYEHSLRLDLGRRPVLVTGNFKDSPDEGSVGETKQCDFQVSLTESQADNVERLANRLKFCSRDIEIEEEVDFGELRTIAVTDRNGVTTTAYKYDLGETFPDDQTWICGGRSAFYSYVKAVVSRKVPVNCPPGAIKKF
ncbi:MAG: hypothetical protein V4598_09425 [Bdellovibrionota bacterium]